MINKFREAKFMWIKIGIAGCLVLMGVLGLKALGITASTVSPERIREFVLSFGIWAPLVYLIVYGQPIVPLPASMMTITGGLAFGPFWGMLAALVGATVRACGQFLIAKSWGRNAVEKLIKGRLVKLNQRITEHGFTAVLLVRLIPNFPFDVQNYGLGLSQVRFGPYALATFLGLIPASLAFVYLGYSLTDWRNSWKILVAILLIIGLTLAQRWYVKRQPVSPLKPISKPT